MSLMKLRKVSREFEAHRCLPQVDSCSAQTRGSAGRLWAEPSNRIAQDRFLFNSFSDGFFPDWKPEICFTRVRRCFL